MGLDISVYTVEGITEDEEEYGFYSFLEIDEWASRCENLQKNTYYNGKCIFRGPSYAYSHHSRFRCNLLRLVSRFDLLDERGIIWDAITKDIPFYELINFSDCEGVIDWECAERIYADFLKYNCLIVEENEFSEDYKEWMETFKIATESKGVVVFH